MTTLRTIAALACLVCACTERDPGGDATSSGPTGGPAGDATGGIPTTGDGTTDDGTTDDGTTGDGTTGDGTTGDVDPPAPPSNNYLLAISTVVDRTKPFQFIATISVADGGTPLSLALQPLTLDQGRVTTPREPFGPPLQFVNVPVIAGEFTVPLGPLVYLGPTNPITGGDVTASLTLHGKLAGADLVCGTVTGEITAPIQSLLDGSSFAATRLTGGLPTEVVIDCGGASVTDP